MISAGLYLSGCAVPDDGRIYGPGGTTAYALAPDLIEVASNDVREPTFWCGVAAWARANQADWSDRIFVVREVAPSTVEDGRRRSVLFTTSPDRISVPLRTDVYGYRPGTSKTVTEANKNCARLESFRVF